MDEILKYGLFLEKTTSINIYPNFGQPFVKFQVISSNPPTYDECKNGNKLEGVGGK